MVFDLKANLVDVGTAFLYDNTEEEIFMECPSGMTEAEEVGALALNKFVYGIVQAARQYH